jgi:hypothetical protein
MRDNGARRLWWHATRRYRDGERVVMVVPLRRTRRGPVPVLPRRCELVGCAALVVGQRRATVIVRRWSEKVDQHLADAGVARLVETMYGGDVQRIQLPPAVAELVGS